ncbi:MAG: LptE family protein [Deltaproteobacteria bacterium]|nr:LptE family protein [Deltaproteobacteria bacterium]
MVESLCLFAACAGCGYAVGYKKAGPVGSAKSVAVPVLLNNTHEAGVEYMFTEALRREFALDPKTGVLGTGDAEIVITGTVNTLSSYPVSFLSGGTGLAIGEYTVSAQVVIEARSKGQPAPVYTGAFSASEQYLSANDPVGTESNRRMAIGRLAKRVMWEAHEMMIAAF